MKPHMTAAKPLQLAGTPREVGRSHGEEYRDAIHKFIGLLRENAEARVRVKAGTKILNDFLRKLWAYSIEYDNDLADEIEGIAEGAHLPLMEIVFLNAFLDLVNTRDDRIAASLLGCTSYAIAPAAAENSRTYVGQNYDMEAFYKEFSTLLEVAVDGGPSCLVYTYKGVVGCAGLNSEGIGLCINFLHPRDAGYGVMYPFLVRKILKQVRIGDAIGSATIGYRAGGVNLVIGHESGVIVCIETSARDHDVILPTVGVVAHANHYLSPHMRKYDLVIWDTSYDSAVARRGSTIMRWLRADELLHERAGAINLDVLKELARDHTNYPYSICFHGDSGEGEVLRGETNASIILDLQERTLHLANGLPCEEEYREIVLRE